MHIMIDFETLSLKPNAVLLALGAVAFDADTGVLLEQFYVNIDPRIQPGRDISASTVLWWMQQNDEARQRLTNATAMADLKDSESFDDLPDAEQDRIFAEHAMPINHAAQAFIAWYDYVVGDLGGNKLDGVWACGGIDHTWLESMMEYSGFKNPVDYWLQRDYRTLRKLYPQVIAPPFEGAQHDAAADAMYQTAHLLDILQHIGQARSKPALTVVPKE